MFDDRAKTKIGKEPRREDFAMFSQLHQFNDTSESRVCKSRRGGGANLLTEDQIPMHHAMCTVHSWSCKTLNRSSKETHALLMGRTTVHWIACAFTVRRKVHTRLAFVHSLRGARIRTRHCRGMTFHCDERRDKKASCDVYIYIYVCVFVFVCVALY